jgi:hypothetical protein
MGPMEVVVEGGQKNQTRFLGKTGTGGKKQGF